MRARLTTLAMTLMLVVLSVCGLGCDEEPSRWEPSGVHYLQCLSKYEVSRRRIDLLFVVDDSSAMAGFERRLRQEMPAMIGALQNLTGGLPDLHLGVVTTVLGTGPYEVPGCPLAGHEGHMQTGSGVGPVGASYLKDVKPSGCIQTLDATGICTTHTCGEANCGHESGTWLVSDAAGCPRCRNYSGSLAEAFADMADIGVSECPFSQPLKAMKLALQNDVNPGFVRDDAFLGIVFITAQDDCSAQDARLFDGADSTLGPLSPFRCFEQGVTCDVNGREPGLRRDCAPREDAASLISPLSGYVTYLQGIKDPQLLLVAGVVGPFDGDDAVTVLTDAQGKPRLSSSCTQDATANAMPAVRLHSFLDAFNEEEDLFWAQTSICGADYTAAFSGVRSGTTGEAPPACFELPLRGCSDPAAAEGLPGDGQPCNDTCRPHCSVIDVQQRGTPSETQAAVPPCLEICAEGPCPGNPDAELAYAGGQPVERDFRLPVEACWYARTSAWCQHGSTLVVARRADAPPRSFVNICCELIPDLETLCDDGLDGDGDCLVDGDDPDCAGP